MCAQLFFILLFQCLGLCTSNDEIHSSIVLCGDPKQLGAVTQSKLAVEIGFNVSLMERLMDQNPYRANSSGYYNSEYITQLTKNYRSHEKILHMPNVLFYKGTLEAKASSGNGSKKKNE